MDAKTVDELARNLKELCEEHRRLGYLVADLERWWLDQIKMLNPDKAAELQSLKRRRSDVNDILERIRRASSEY